MCFQKVILFYQSLHGYKSYAHHIRLVDGFVVTNNAISTLAKSIVEIPRHKPVVAKYFRV